MSFRCSTLARWALSAVCLSLGSACQEDAKKLTQIVVVVDSDLPVPDQLDGLQIEVSGTKPMPEIDTPLDADHTLPRTLGIVYSGGELGPLRVLARGMHEGSMVVERMADVSFKRDHTVKLALALTRACLMKPSCPEDETCDQGECVPAAMSDLPVFDGKDGSFLPDAGPYQNPQPALDSGAAEGGMDAAQDAATDAGADAGASAIVCAVTKPLEGEAFYEGDEIAFEGSCLDADGKQVAVRWLSTLEEGNLSTKKAFKSSSLNTGTHEISLCTGNMSACAAPSLHITVKPVPEISATISSLAQAGATEGVYKADTELIANGEASGVPPLTLRWIDSLAGEVCSTKSCRFDAPLLPGRHLLRLVVTDARGRTQSAERGFIVHVAGQDALFQAYAVANSVLSASGTVSALASDGTVHFVGTENGYLLQVQLDASASASPSITPTAVTEPRPRVADIFVHRSSNRLYLATSSDVQACDISNATVSACTKQMLGGFAAAVPRSVRRVTSDATEYLTVGTSTGLWVGALNMLDKGSLRENNAMFNAISESTGSLWLAASSGLFGYTLGSGAAITGSPKKFSGASGALSGIVASADSVWASLGSGFTRYDVNAASWTTWTTTYTKALFGRLVSNEVRSIAITHPVIDGAARDVIWLGTSAGLNRFDASIPSFTTYTTSDGLPDNSVLKVLGLPNNEVLLATPSGLVIHHGQ